MTRRVARRLGPCAGKLRHETEPTAAAEADKLTSRYGQAIHHYHCRACDGWHTTSREWRSFRATVDREQPLDDIGRGQAVTLLRTLWSSR